MAQEDEVFDSTEEADYDDFVAAVFARSREEAEVYCELLNDHDIPTRLGDEADLDEKTLGNPAVHRGITHGVPVLVPDILLDEASVIIARQEDIEEYDPTAEDDVDEDDLDLPEIDDPAEFLGDDNEPLDEEASGP